MTLDQVECLWGQEPEKLNARCGMKEDKWGWTVCVGTLWCCQPCFADRLWSSSYWPEGDKRPGRCDYWDGRTGKPHISSLGLGSSLDWWTHTVPNLYQTPLGAQGLSTELWHLNDTTYPVRQITAGSKFPRGSATSEECFAEVACQCMKSWIQ